MILTVLLANWHLASITIAGDIIFLAIPRAANFIALIERLACGSGGCRGANWGGLAYVRVIRADTRGLSRREKTDNKFTEWGRRDPPYQDPCQVPLLLLQLQLLGRVPQTTESNSCTSEGAGPYCAAVTGVHHSASNKLNPTIVTAVCKVDNCVPGSPYSSLDYYKLTAVSKE